jgi:hypothetical protein
LVSRAAIESYDTSWFEALQGNEYRSLLRLERLRLARETEIQRDTPPYGTSH